MSSVQRMVTHQGRTQTYAAWAKELGWSIDGVRGYVRRYGVLPAPRLTLRSIACDGSWEADTKAQQLVAERGALTLEEIGDHMGVTRERVRQIQNAAMRKLKNRAPSLAAQLEALDELRDQHDTREFLRRRQA